MLPPHRPFRDKPADVAAPPAVAARPNDAGPLVMLRSQQRARISASSRKSLKGDLKVAGRANDGDTASGGC